MVKKKITEAEDSKGKKIDEKTDNKDDKQLGTEEIQNMEGAKTDTATSKSDQKSDAEADVVSDKVEPVEKTLEVKLAEMQDKYLRLSAEFDNYRKRTLREKMEISKYAEEELLKKILPFMDDFERAMRHIEGSKDCTGVKEGMDLIYMKLSEFFKQQGLKEIESLNSDFNVELHDAVAQVPVKEEERKGKIVDVVLKGYYLKDKVIRHSKVVIGE
jgi:molecular chaperone GrpE